MFKILLGNALFAGCVVAWYFYVDDRGLALAGTILAFGCFLSGIFMGYLLRGPGKARRTFSSTPARSFLAPPVMDEEFEPEPEAEAEEPSLESQIPVEPERDEELELPLVIPNAVDRPVDVKLFGDVLPAEVPASPVASNPTIAAAVETHPAMEMPVISAAATIGPAPASVPKPVPPVEIHEPAMQVVVDSDGCYEMVAVETLKPEPEAPPQGRENAE